MRRLIPLILLAVGACADYESPMESTSAAAHRSGDAYGPEAASAAQQDLPRALAMALGSTSLRSALRDELRASPYSEHKIELADLVSSARTGAIVSELARLSGSTPRDIATLIGTQPPADLYLPHRDERTSWTPAAPLIVVDARGSSSIAYLADGSTVDFDPSTGRVPGVAVLVLDDPEPKFHRLESVAVKGEAVQSPDESDLGAGLSREDGETMDLMGSSEMVGALATGMQQAECLDCGGDGGGDLPPGSRVDPEDYTSLLELYVAAQPDAMGSCAEVRIKFRYRRSDASVVSTSTYTLSGVCSSLIKAPQVEIFHKRMPHYCADYIDSEAWEVDNWYEGGEDDFIGWSDPADRYTYMTNGEIQDILDEEPFNPPIAASVVLEWEPVYWPGMFPCYSSSSGGGGDDDGGSGGGGGGGGTECPDGPEEPGGGGGFAVLGRAIADEEPCD